MIAREKQFLLKLTRSDVKQARDGNRQRANLSEIIRDHNGTKQTTNKHFLVPGKCIHFFLALPGVSVTNCLGRWAWLMPHIATFSKRGWTEQYCIETLTAYQFFAQQPKHSKEHVFPSQLRIPCESSNTYFVERRIPDRNVWLTNINMRARANPRYHGYQGLSQAFCGSTEPGNEMN